MRSINLFKVKRKTLCSKFLLPVLFLFANIAADGQEIDAPSNQSPYHTIVTHLQYLQPETYQPELTRICFDASLDSATAVGISKQLKMILDAKGLYVATSQLPNDPSFEDSISGRNVYVLFRDELPQVYVVKQGNTWIYSSETVSSVPDLIRMAYPWGTHHLIKLFPVDTSQRVLGLSGWQYLGLLALLILSFLIYYVLYFVFNRLFNRLIKKRLKNWQVEDKLIWTIARLSSLLLVFQIAYTLFPVLRFPVQSTRFLLMAFKIVLAVLIMVLSFRIIDLVVSQLNRVVTRTESKMDDQLMPILNRISKIIIGFLAFIYILNLLDVNITAILAGVSIGGLALALAAQDTVKNLLGSLMIFVDKPFQIGDYIEVDGTAGTVEEVGFRTTRIRTADTSLVAIPNGNVANFSINNKGVRPMRLLHIDIGVTYNTPRRYLQVLKDGLEEFVQRHPGLADEPRYVFINSLDASAINIMFRAYVQTDVWAEELAVREQVIMKILEFAELLGISIAFPSSTIYIDQIPGQAPLNNTFNYDEAELEKRKEAFLNSFNETPLT